MEWWAALLVAGVPAAITSISLIVQQRFNAGASERADENRRLDAEAERQHQERLLEVANSHAREQADQDQKRQARESWKADRRASHTRLLTRLEEVEAAARTVLAGVSVDLSIGGDLGARDFELPELPQELVADVALVGSDTSAAEAQKARGAVMVLDVNVAVIALLHKGRTTDEVQSDLALAERSATNLRDAITAYRQAAKQDMDTVS